MKWDDYFYYDETSPSCLRWKITRHQTEPYFKVLCTCGDIAGRKDSKGYWMINTRGLVGTGVKASWGAHRVVFELLTRKQIQKGFVIDHKDRNPSNNLSENLREVEWKYNARNRGKICGKIGDGISVCIKRWPAPNEDKTTKYLLARVTAEGGKRIQKHFSITRLGYDTAMEEAKAWREGVIAQLNEQGAGYSPTHGK